MSIMLFAAAASAFQAPATPPLRLHRAVASSAVLGQGAPVMVAGAPAMIPTASRPAFIASVMAASRPVQALICVLVVGFLVLANEMKKRASLDSLDSLLDDSESCESGNLEACTNYDKAVENHPDMGTAFSRSAGVGSGALLATARDVHAHLKLVLLRVPHGGKGSVAALIGAHGSRWLRARGGTARRSSGADLRCMGVRRLSGAC